MCFDVCFFSSCSCAPLSLRSLKVYKSTNALVFKNLCSDGRPTSGTHGSHLTSLKCCCSPDNSLSRGQVDFSIIPMCISLPSCYHQPLRKRCIYIYIKKKEKILWPKFQMTALTFTKQRWDQCKNLSKLYSTGMKFMLWTWNSVPKWNNVWLYKRKRRIQSSL